VPNQAVIPTALTIAGSDPSGGAGIQADLKTFHQHQVYGMSVITLLTVQNTQTVKQIELVDDLIVAAQLNAVLEDIPPLAIKTGALGNASIINSISQILSTTKVPLVVDPVMISTHGASLLDPDAVNVMIDQLLPLTHLLTPNIPEAEALSGMAIQTKDDALAAATIIQGFGPKNILIKGGHRENDATDLLLVGDKLLAFEAQRIETTSTHGTGCSYAAAIVANLAKGAQLPDAVRQAKQYINQAIKTAPKLGKGHGPINHFALS
jgi:hydroxymethylpyrimidine/phosphomethylpyrimidine kinase